MSPAAPLRDTTAKQLSDGWLTLMIAALKQTRDPRCDDGLRYFGHLCFAHHALALRTARS